MKNGKYMKKRALNVKALALVLTLSLLVCGAIGGTIAWLADDTDPVVNTFTDSDVDIELTETEGDENDDGEREFKMVPGATIEKDPKVTVSATSEDCYVFVKVEKSANFDTFMEFEMADGWEQVDGTTNVYSRVVNNTDNPREFSVLKDDQVTVKSSVTRDMMQDIKDTQPTLTFTAYAIQKSYLKNGETAVTDAAGAWALVNP